MDCIEAIYGRHSVRDFQSKPVSRRTLVKILEAATRSPSGGNGQPWEVFVATGTTLEIIRSQYRERFLNQTAATVQPSGPPPSQVARIQERHMIMQREQMALLGIDPEDPAGSQKVYTEWRAHLFGVPALVVVCTDKELTNMMDIGIFIQTLCIAAKGYGVDSMIAGMFLRAMDVIRKELEIPDNLKAVMGVGLGYASSKSIINTYRSSRRPFDEVVRFKS
jgi:nitroreductase